MIKLLFRKFGYMPISEHEVQLKLIADREKVGSTLEIKQGEIDALFDVENDAYKTALFRRVFNTRAGRLILAYLRKMYSTSIPNFEQPNFNYFTSGKLRAVEEMEIIANRQIKSKKEKK